MSSFLFAVGMTWLVVLFFDIVFLFGYLVMRYRHQPLDTMSLREVAQYDNIAFGLLLIFSVLTLYIVWGRFIEK